MHVVQCTAGSGIHPSPGAPSLFGHCREPTLSLRPHLRVEEIGTDVVVLDTRVHVVHRLVGDAAEAVRALAAGTAVVDLPEHLGTAVDALRSADLLDEPDLPSRRRLLRAGLASAAAIGLTTLALPSAAAAASVVNQGGGGGAGITTYTLTVALAGTGGGYVVSNPVGIDTRVPVMSNTIQAGFTVTLTATANADSTFEGWSGGATDTAASVAVTVSADTTVTATFRVVDVAAAVAGNGQVTVSWDET
jgi:hypothetical protein